MSNQVKSSLLQDVVDYAPMTPSVDTTLLQMSCGDILKTRPPVRRAMLACLAATPLSLQKCDLYICMRTCLVCLTILDTYFVGCTSQTLNLHCKSLCTVICWPCLAANSKQNISHHRKTNMHNTPCALHGRMVWIYNVDDFNLMSFMKCRLYFWTMGMQTSNNAYNLWTGAMCVSLGLNGMPLCQKVLGPSHKAGLCCSFW